MACASKRTRHYAPLIKDGVKSSRAHTEFEEKRESIYHNEPDGYGRETHGRDSIAQWNHTSLHSGKALSRCTPQPGEHLVWVGNMVLQHRQRAITSIADEHVSRGVRQG
jgi:hypothetical protein